MQLIVWTAKDTSARQNRRQVARKFVQALTVYTLLELELARVW